MTKYPFLDLHDATAPFRDDIIKAITDVVDSGRYVGGYACEKFEKELAEITGVPYCVGVSNGLDALRLIFRVYIELGVLKKGDEVIVPANTYIASILAVTDNGLIPVFVEPDNRTLNLNWDNVLAAITPRTRAVLTVHLYGRVAWDDVIASRLRDKGIILVEDNAQAIGALSIKGMRTGALGDAAAFSFYPTKNIGALGDAGAVTTYDRKVADMVRSLANYGSDRRYHNIVQGYNCRLDPIQAAVLSVKLKRLDEENERRRALADIYTSNIKNPKITLPLSADQDMVWHQYVIQTENRDEFTQFLDRNGVGWDIHYAVPPHRQPCYQKEFGHLDLPVTDKIARTVVSLPISPTTTADDAKMIATIVNTF
ncbi:MAG: DegT/DnrJ/EryC1/StrS family aminotransferase [Muribaculaceae bacterium]|nr:DegT/DnrJ/EryC1/StrS family aminotransferase [Muribaculaceae bacterium]